MTVIIDHKSWRRRLIPPGLANAHQTVSVNTVSAFLMLAFLTRPSLKAGISINDFWAWLRYFPALASSPELLLALAYADLDPHQKTILSDDWGMCLSMWWLQSALDGALVCDGRYFIERHSHLLAHKVKPKKRGVGKTPDFVMQDNAGNWHVIECKGTQSSRYQQMLQLDDGKLQKNSIIFPKAVRGQKLVAGVFIGMERLNSESTLCIVDPPDEPEDYKVTNKTLKFADDALLRSQAARALNLVGLEDASGVILDPIGTSSLSPGIRRRVRVVEATARRERARRSFEFPEDRNFKSVASGVRRTITVEFPQPVIFPPFDKRYSAARITQSASREFLRAVRAEVQETVDDELAQEQDWSSQVAGLKVEGEAAAAIVKVGSAVSLELELV